MNLSDAIGLELERRERGIGAANIAELRDILLSAAHKISEQQARIEALEEKYNDLLYQVQNKIPGESRHETAKRIIHQHENREAQCSSNIAKNTTTQK